MSTEKTTYIRDSGGHVTGRDVTVSDGDSSVTTTTTGEMVAFLGYSHDMGADKTVTTHHKDGTSTSKTVSRW